MKIVHLTNYQYSLSVPEKNEKVESKYQLSLNKYIEESMKDKNTMKVNSFRKKYHSYADAFKGKINETKDE